MAINFKHEFIVLVAGIATKPESRDACMFVSGRHRKHKTLIFSLPLHTPGSSILCVDKLLQ